MHDNTTPEQSKSNTDIDLPEAPKASESILDTTVDALKAFSGVLFNDADAAEVDSFDHSKNREPNLHDENSEIGFMRRMYAYADFLLEESHRMNYMAEQGLEKIYEEHPQLRENDAEYRAGFNKFRGMIPQNVNDLALDLALGAGLGAGAKAAGPLLNKTKNMLNQYNHQRKINKSLGANPFKGKNFNKIDKQLRKEGFSTNGGDPLGGKGAYFHPKTGRKYYLDKADKEKAIKGNQRETPHVDVHRKFNGKNIQYPHQIPKNTDINEPKRKYPLGEKLYVPK